MAIDDWGLSSLFEDLWTKPKPNAPNMEASLTLEDKQKKGPT